MCQGWGWKNKGMYSWHHISDLEKVNCSSFYDNKKTPVVSFGKYNKQPYISLRQNLLLYNNFINRGFHGVSSIFWLLEFGSQIEICKLSTVCALSMFSKTVQINVFYPFSQSHVVQPTPYKHVLRQEVISNYHPFYA